MDTVSTEHVQEDESNKPLNRPYYQQTLPSWSPLLTPWRAAGGYLLIALIFVPLGAVLLADLSTNVELRYQYDGDGSDGDGCKISEYREGKACTITFNVTEDMSGPVYVYYELTNFYQNHATYVDSYYQSQLQGSLSTSDASDECDPLVYNGSLVLNPCGLIANSLFNDIITLTSGQEMDETNIAWNSDVSEKFEQPDGFVTGACTTGTCAECLAALGETDADGGVVFDGCGLYPDENSQTDAYYYPEEDTFQFLYETFPEVISPLVGVKDEHFIVWMRVSGLKDFRKLYGKIEDGLSAGDTVTFAVTSNFIVDYYDGTKSIILSTTTALGGRNPYWGRSLLTVGIIMVVVAALLAVKYKVWPRVMGDITKLVDDA